MSAASDVVAKLVTLIKDSAGTSLDASSATKLTAVATVLESVADVVVPTLEAHNPTMEAVLVAIVKLETDLDTVSEDIRALVAATKTPVAAAA